MHINIVGLWSSDSRTYQLPLYSLYSSKNKNSEEIREGMVKTTKNIPFIKCHISDKGPAIVSFYPVQLISYSIPIPITLQMKKVHFFRVQTTDQSLTQYLCYIIITEKVTGQYLILYISLSGINISFAIPTNTNYILYKGG